MKRFFHHILALILSFIPSGQLAAVLSELGLSALADYFTKSEIRSFYLIWLITTMIFYYNVAKRKIIIRGISENL